ncbi:peptide chain release factor 2 [Candidatus Gracilibacteria bacterium]|nr:peptide chain release factor 2 [Candidatus Gracilibacteria bacterium]
MLFDDLQEQLKNLEPTLHTIKTFWANSNQEEKIKELELLAQDPSVWQDPQKAYILKDLQALKNQKEVFETIVAGFSDGQEMLHLFKDDEAELEKLAQEITVLGGSIRSFKIQLLLNEPDDRSNCYVSINAGAGGTESQDWAEMLCRMYIRFCEKNRLEASILDHQTGEEAGMKSATLLIKGKNAYGLFKSEHGTHRLVRISPYDSNKRRHTSFAGVFVTPEMEKVEIEIDPKDLRIDTYRASGAGGQHVNKTDSAVRITHQPSGIVVQCQNQRSQLQNKESCMKMLKAKLVQRQKEEENAKSASVEKKKIEWGSQIRSYVLHPYKMVKDHRTNHESSQPDLVLDGDLIAFIEAYLIS